MATNTPKSQSSLNHHSTNPSSSSPQQVRVILRVRPFLLSEIGTDGKMPMPTPTPCISALDAGTNSRGEVTVHIKDPWSSRNEFYKLDSFFGQEDGVGQIFRDEVSGVIPRIFQGSNVTIFAYGATGSGKTYAMQGTEEEPGLIPLAMSTILSSCWNTEVSIQISYYEVYMDRCYDLLEPKAKEIMTLNDKDGKVQLKGLSWVPVRSMEEFREVFSTGVQRRKVARTGLNDVSSRSHGILAIAVTYGNTKGKLNLIDLAGNEDNRRTCNEGLRLQESAKINQSLFALSNVIYALNNNETYVPYRESKLTRILQDSLGGTSQALMVACLNPISYQEAVHTVSLAARSRQIVNYPGSAYKKDTPREKVDMEAKLRAWLESKGKTKSTQKKLESSCSSSKANPMNRLDAKTKGRKLFDLGTTATATMEKACPSDTWEHGDEDDTHQINCPSVTEIANCQKCPTTPNDTDQLYLSVKARPSDTRKHGDEDDMHLKTCPSITEIVNCQKCLTTPNDTDQLHLPADAEDQKSITHVKVLKSLDSLVSPCNNENLQSLMNTLGSPLQKSIRKVLSPISTNTPKGHHKFEPMTPKTPYMTCDEDKAQMTATPLDKFNALGSNLKESLAQEYLAFLNVASKEELVQLKGIGQRRAEYILGLREHTPNPLKSLSDLENIGLSSKQVHGMFRRMATGIFSCDLPI